MLNPFPDLLTFSFFAPLLLRLVAGLIILNLGILAFRREKSSTVVVLRILRIPSPTGNARLLAIIEIVGGVMLILGLYTQVAALALCILLLCEMLIEYKDPDIIKRGFSFFLLLFAICFSLLLTGAGAIAFDMPL